MSAPIEIPARLRATCDGSPERAAWLARLPTTVRALQRRWSLDVGAPFGAEASCAWVAPATRADGTRVVLKLGMPHMEAEHEIDGLRFWDGEPTVVLIDSDVEHNAMLLEACAPGTPLRTRPESEQDVVIADLLRRLWRRPAAPHPFLPLSVMTAHWGNAARLDARALARSGARAGRSAPLCRTVRQFAGRCAARDRSARRQCARGAARAVARHRSRNRSSAIARTTPPSICSMDLPRLTLDLIRRFADLLGVEHERVRLWTFARLVAEPRDDWSDTRYDLARSLAP